MNKKNFISVIIPVHNSAKYLRKCLDSVINQNYAKLEIICIDDGSTDNSLSILQEYATKDNRIQIVSQSNQGQSHARNIGLKLATGEFITFIDSDDYLKLGCYEIIIDIFLKQDVDVVNFGIAMVDEQDNALDSSYFAMQSEGKILLTEKIQEETKWEVWSKVFKNSLIQNYQISFPEGVYFEDLVFSRKYLAVSRYIYNLPMVFYSYVQHKNSTMDRLRSKKSYMYLDYFKCFESIYIFFKENNIILNKLLLNLFKYCCNNAIFYSRKKDIYTTFQLANQIILNNKLNDIFPNDEFINYIHTKKYWLINKNALSFKQRLFFIYKDGNYNYLNFLGFRLKF